MAIAASDIQVHGTVTTGSAGNTVANTVAGTNLGKYASTTLITATDAASGNNNLFDDITGAQNAASQVDYQAIGIHNAHASLDATSMTAYISSEVAGGASMAIGLDTTAASAIGASTAQLVTIANKTTAPSGASFSSPTTDGTGLAIGTLAHGNVKGLWIRRTAANTSAVNNDGGVLGFSFDTSA